MILEGLAVATLATFYDANKSLNMDERALEKYAKAFEKNQEGQLLVRKKAEFTDKRLGNVAKKKRAIIQVSLPKFVDIYSKIQKVEMENKTNINEVALRNYIQDISKLDSLSIDIKQNFTDKELVCGMLKGFGKMMQMDSQRYLSAANNTLKSANVAYSQCESIAAVYDAIVARADRVANLLKAMNVLFIKSINETAKTIEKNGLNVRNYSEYDKGVLMTCVNIAVAMCDFIKIPVVNEKGEIYESATEMIETGEQYLEKIDKIIK